MAWINCVPTSTYRQSPKRGAARPPTLEPLEDRQLLSTCHVTRLSDSGVGKGFRGDLRYCINKVQAEPGPDVIDFTVTGAINLSDALPDLTTEIDIQGPGSDGLQVSAGGHQVRIFNVTVDADVAVTGLTISDGYVFSDGGGIANAGKLSLDGVHIGSNTAWGKGGGIYNAGQLTIHDSVIEKHQAFQGTMAGGGIYNVGTLTISHSLLADNQARSGGGIYNTGTVTLDNAVLSANIAYYGSGGGVYNTGTVAITDSAVNDNVARKDAINLEHPYGGGIFSDGMIWIDSSTIANNQTFNVPGGGRGNGGGICIFTHGTAVIRNSTITNNSAGYGGGGLASFGMQTDIDHSTIATNYGRVAGGVWNDNDYGVDLRNTIVAMNTASESELGPDVVGQFASAGHNLIGDTGQGGGFATTDLLDVDPLLGPLADNGGPTLTHALLPGSPAIDAGDNTDAPEWDQRGPGFPRIVNGTIDIGAFEVQASPIPPAAFARHDLLALILATADLDSLV